MKKLLIFLFAFLFLFSNNIFAQADSNKVEIDLDYLVGRIIDGFKVTGIYTKDRQRSLGFGTEYYSSNDNYTPGLAIAKKDLFQIKFELPVSNDYYSPGIRIDYRPKKKINFSFSGNSTKQKDKDISQYSNLNKIFETKQYHDYIFQIHYLSLGEQTGDNILSKWFYFNSRSICLNPDQLYFNLTTQYYERKRKTVESNIFDPHNPPLCIEQQNDYHYGKTQKIDMVLAYNFRNKIILETGLSGNFSNTNLNQQHDLVQYQTADYYLLHQFQYNSRSHGVSFGLELSSFTTENTRNEIIYRRSTGFNDDFSYSFSQGKSRFNDSDRTQVYDYFHYAFSFFKIDQSVSLEQVLSNYSGYYPPLLPGKAFFWVSDLRYIKTAIQLEETRTYETESSPSLINPISWNNDLRYGISDKFSTALSISSSYDDYHYRMQLSGAIGFTYCNYKFDPAIMSWATLTDFDYWQGPLLKPGMKILTIGYILPDFNMDLAFSSKKFMAVEDKKIDFGKRNGVSLRYKAGFLGNLEFRVTSSLWFLENQDDFQISPTFKLSLSRNTRLQINYSYNFSKQKDANYTYKNFHFLASFAGLF